MIDQDNKPHGAMAIADALRLAQSQGLDLIEIAPQAEPPVCRIADFGAFLYRQEKTERKQKARQKKTDIKGIRVTYNIGAHDRDMLLDRARKFIEQGHKVKIEMLLMGRQRAFRDRGKESLKEFAEQIADVAKVESDMGQQGHKYFLILVKK